MIMAVIYFGCAMRPGRSLVGEEKLAEIVEAIEELGYELASKHTLQKDIVEEELKLSNTEIHDRDYEWISGADAGVFEITNPSLGVGAEISDLLYLEKPVLCLFKRGFEKSISAYIQGKNGSKFVKALLETHSYQTKEEAKGIIKNFLEKTLG